MRTNGTAFPVRPLLRWAGGKQRLVKLLMPFVPARDKYRRYYEPFFGGGALFFAVQPPRAVLSDINADLMNCYHQVARHPNAISRILEWYARRDSRGFFYKIRDIPVEKLSLKERAARFIYLNKAAFNGIYRVNMAGAFNVPYGPSFNGPAIPSRESLSLAARCLRKAKILMGDFEKVLASASAGDFVYLDPPYPPRSDTAFFTHYSRERFGWNEQMRVAEVFSELTDRGCLVMLSNSDQRRVVDLFAKVHVFRLKAIRWLGSNGDRFHVREIVVTNYDPSDPSEIVGL